MRRGEGVWEYPPLESSMEEAVFEEIGVYIQKRKNMVVQYIATRPIWTSERDFFGGREPEFLGGGGKRRD